MIKFTFKKARNSLSEVSANLFRLSSSQKALLLSGIGIVAIGGLKAYFDYRQKQVTQVTSSVTPRYQTNR